MRQLFIIIFFSISFLAQAKEYPKSDHFDGTKFFNPEKNQLHSFFELMKWQITKEDNEWPDHVANKTYPLPTISPEQRAVATWIGHATFLIQLKDLNVLTDPVFAERASPLKFMGPKRVRLPGLNLEELPKIDVVVVSHNHYDHLDLDSLKMLDAKFFLYQLQKYFHLKFLEAPTQVQV